MELPINLNLQMTETENRIQVLKNSFSPWAAKEAHAHTSSKLR